MNALNTLKKASLALAILGTIGCADATTTEPVATDDAPIRVSVDGRGDSNGVPVTTTELEIVLEIANTYSFEELDALLDVRAARNIVEARADGPFTTLAELDDVSWVGARAFDALLDEARTFAVGTDPVQFDVSDYFKAGTDPYAPSDVQLQFFGELASDLSEQPFVGRLMKCDDSGQCNFHYRFDKVRDYSDTAGPGNVVVSFRTSDVSYAPQASGLRRLASNVMESGNAGPMECAVVPNDGPCIALYGGCTTQYRCSVRIPE